MILKNANRTILRNYGIKLPRETLFIIATVVTILTTPAIAATESNQELLGPDNWPLTVEAAAQDFLLRIPPFEKTKIKQTNKADIASLYFDLGTKTRNRYGLWRGNDKLIFSACGFQCHPDDAAMKIIEAVWQKLQK